MMSSMGRKTDVFLIDRGQGHDVLRSAVQVQTGLNTTISAGSEIFYTTNSRGETWDVEAQDPDGNTWSGRVEINNGETITRKARFTEKAIYGGNTDTDQDTIIFSKEITYHDIFGTLATADPTQLTHLNLPYEQYFYNNNIITNQELLSSLNNFDLVIGIKSPNSYIPNTNPSPENFSSSIRIQGGGELNLEAVGFSNEFRLEGEYAGSTSFDGENSYSIAYFNPVKTYQGKQYSFDTSSSSVNRLGFEDSAHLDFGHVKYFKDGTVEADTLTADAEKASWLYAGALSDNLIGSSKGDILVGGTQDDYLQGGGGDDQYAYWLGDGHDIITDLDGTDTIVFGGGIDEKHIKVKFGKLDDPSIPASFRDLKAGEEFQSDVKLEIYDPQTNALSGSITIVNFQPQLTDLQSNINKQDRLRFAGDIEYTYSELLKQQGLTLIPPIQWSENNHFYTLTSTAQTWDQAEAEAVALGGHLVAVNSASEQQFLVDTFLSGTNRKIPYWIGLNDAARERRFVWTTGEPVTYTNWQRGEPNNADRGREDYAHLNWHYAVGKSNSIGTWNDTERDEHYLGIIEIDPFEPTINLAVSPSSVSEDGTNNIVYTFTRSGHTFKPLTVNFTIDGSAIFNADYTLTGATLVGTNGTINFEANANTAIVTVDPNSDTESEINETVTLTLTSANDYELGSQVSATGTIFNDDISSGNNDTNLENNTTSPGNSDLVTVTIPFDASQYGASNPDLIQVFGHNLEAFQQHYLFAGRFEGRNLDSFDEFRYIASNPDLITSFGLNGAVATDHYISYGYFEGRSLTNFDPARYLDSYDDLMGVFGTNTQAATQHYITSGFWEGRNPNLFNSDRYLASHGDLIQAFRYNLEAGSNHYLFSGRNEGRQITFDPVAYLNSNPDLNAFYNGDLSGATQHYILYGFDEGRLVTSLS